MADTLAVELKASLSWLFQDAIDLSIVADGSKLDYARSMADGTAVDQADKLWHDSRTVAAGGNDDLDLTALAQSLFGGTITTNLAKVKAILVVNTSVTTGEKLVLRCDATNGFTGWSNGVTTARAEVGPDSPLLLVNKKDGWSSSGTSKILRVQNPSAAAITYKIAIVGTSA